MKKMLAYLCLPLLSLFAEGTDGTCRVLPGAEPPIVCAKGFYLTGEVLYWTAQEEGLGYTTTRFSNFLSSPELGRGTVLHPEFGFDPGVKVGVGFDLGHDDWDLFIEYTWLGTRDRTSSMGVKSSLDTEHGADWLFEDTSGALIAPNDPVTEASAEWHLHFNVIDLEWARHFYAGRFLTLRPLFGLKSTWQKQVYEVDYQVFTFDSADNDMTIVQTQRVWGIGPRTGLHADWRLNTYFTLVGRMALSALWSHFNVTRKDQATDIATVGQPELTTLNTSESIYAPTTVLELFMGIRWGKFFRGDRYFFQIDLGWEEQVWMNQNRFISVYEQGFHGDLAIQGATFRVRLDF